ncbi:MAG: patatin-like phospholipase family protein [Dehalococcoidia bacterium]|nr:patatin-like phospholipase family protein [Dehalococcoidia bacterium]
MSASARKIPKVGLALGGGGARGLAHIGVLKALEEESIPIDMIAGTSAGAMVGACYAKERNASILEELVLGIDWRKMARLVDPNLLLLGKGFVHGDKIKEFGKSIIGDAKFEDLEIPLAVVAADAQTTEEIVIDRGSVLEAVRASISLPVILTPVKHGNRFLIDGGIVNPVPVDVVRNMGAEVVIAVNVEPSPFPKRQVRLTEEKKMPEETPSLRPSSVHLLAVRKKLNSLLREHKERIEVFDRLSKLAESAVYEGRGRLDPETPNIFDVLMHSLEAMQYERIRLRIKAADIVISPDVGDIGMFGFNKGKEAIAQGYKAAKNALPKLQEMICPIAS